MSKLLRDNKPFLLLLVTTTSARQLGTLLRMVTPSQYKALKEIAVNVVEGNLPLTTRQREDLTRHKRSILKFTGKKTTPLKPKWVLCLLKAAKPFLYTA